VKPKNDMFTRAAFNPTIISHLFFLVSEADIFRDKENTEQTYTYHIEPCFSGLSDGNFSLIKVASTANCYRSPPSFSSFLYCFRLSA
jgi:hypothetical protein